MQKKYKCDAFFLAVNRQRLALSYNDVRLKTGYSEILPADISLQTRFSRNISLNIPIASSPMDTVTGAEMAIAMAKLGGIGIIHKGLLPKEQTNAIEKVKHSLSAFISDPICIKSDQTVAEVLEFVKRKGYKFLSFPVLNKSGRLIGVATSSHFEFCSNTSAKISDVMTKEVVSAPDGTTIKQAYKIMMEKRIKILPIFDWKHHNFKGIYTLSDVRRIVSGHSPDYNLAADGTLRVGAAIGIGDDAKHRMELLAKA